MTEKSKQHTELLYNAKLPVRDKVITLRKLLKKLETDFGWTFYDENKKLHLSELQKELIMDVMKATKELIP